jgi:hypothetical protein
MINKSDLKIGNYISYQDETWCVSEILNNTITINSLTLPDVSASINYEEIKPIIISESDLLKFGFEHHKKNVSFNMSGELFDYWEKTWGELNEFGLRPAFVIWTDRKTTLFSLKGIIKLTERSYKYLHELQQFYQLYTDLRLYYEK